MERTPLDSWLAAKMSLSLEELRPEMVEAWQLAALRRTLAQATAHSPFYGERLAGLDPDFPRSLKDLASLPLTTAQDLAGQGPRMLCLSQDEVARVVTLTTSGTSGPAKRLFFTQEDLAATLDFFSQGMATLCGPGDAVLVLLPGRRPDGVADLLARALPRIGARAVLPPEDWNADTLVRLLAEEGVTRLMAAPSQVRVLLGHAAFSAAARERVRAALITAEPMAKELRRAIVRDWNCEAFDHWGMTETGYGGGVECAAHDGYHLREAEFLVEIVDPRNGAPVAQGEQGEIVVSTLDRRGLPLVRYRTGDAARILPGPCACGSPLRRLGAVAGRIEITGGTYCLVQPDKGRAQPCTSFSNS